MRLFCFFTNTVTCFFIWKIDDQKKIERNEVHIFCSFLKRLSFRKHRKKTFSFVGRGREKSFVISFLVITFCYSSLSWQVNCIALLSQYQVIPVARSIFLLVLLLIWIFLVFQLNNRILNLYEHTWKNFWYLVWKFELSKIWDFRLKSHFYIKC